MADYEAINSELNLVDWDEMLLSNANINEIYSNFTSIIEEISKKHIPTKTVTIRPSDKPFMNNEIRLKMRQRNRVHKKAKSTNSITHLEKFRKLRNEVISLIRKSKENYRQRLCSIIA